MFVCVCVCSCVREDLIEEKTFEQRLEGGERVGLKFSAGRVFQAKGTAWTRLRGKCLPGMPRRPVRPEWGAREEAEHAMEAPWLGCPSDLALNLGPAVLQLGDPRALGHAVWTIPTC